MIAPDKDQVAAAKDACRKLFGHDRLVACTIGAPINIVAAVAAFDLKEATAHWHAREVNPIDARSALLASRCLFPSVEDLATLREEWPAADTAIETEFLSAMGFGAGDATCLPLSASSAPKAWAKTGEVNKLISDAYAAADGSKLWVIASRASGLEVIVRQPISDVWTAGCVAVQAAMKSGTMLTALVGFYSDHLVWCAQAFMAHLNERPGRALDLIGPWTEMGGATAVGSHSFL